MKALLVFLRATFLGGILFLLPIVVLVVVLGKAQEIAGRVVAPLASRIAMRSMAGIPTATVLAVGVIVLFCFLAGLYARTRLARKMVEWLESVFLYNIPGYDFFKGISESLIGYEMDHAYPVVLARVEEAWQIGFLMERLESGHYAVFVPGAPSVWSGSVYLMTEDRFQRVDITRVEAVKCLRRLGLGADQLLGQKIGEQALSSGNRRQEAQAIS
jgi:uncharacterized membrane protein